MSSDGLRDMLEWKSIRLKDIVRMITKKKKKTEWKRTKRKSHYLVELQNAFVPTPDDNINKNGTWFECEGNWIHFVGPYNKYDEREINALCQIAFIADRIVSGKLATKSMRRRIRVRISLFTLRHAICLHFDESQQKRCVDVFVPHKL